MKRLRRAHGAPPEQAVPLMPPELFDVLDACATTKTWRTRGRPAEPDLAGARDRALLLVGLVVLPRAGNPARCPIIALTRWQQLAGHHAGPLLRAVGKSNRAGPGALHP